jgi:Trk K+ transport system NAD-binding subunit
VIVLILLKAAVLLVLCRLFGLALSAALRTSLLLVQGGEFGFVLFSTAAAVGVMDPGFYTTLLLVISASMALTPVVVRLGDRLATRLGTAEPVPELNTIHPSAQVLVVGYGRVGQIVMQTLRRAGVEVTAVDIQPTRLAVGQRLSDHVVYRNAAATRLLDQVGSANTRVVVVAVGDPDQTEAVVSAARAAFPQAFVLARAYEDDRCPKLEQLGADVVLSKTFELSLGLAEAALRRLDVSEEVASQALASGQSGAASPLRECQRPLSG